MFSNKISHIVFYRKPNLNNGIFLKNSGNNYILSCNFSIHEIQKANVFTDVANKVKWYLQNVPIIKKCQCIFSIPRTLKHQSANILRVWAHQCECVFAQKLRRGQQMFCLYTRLWEERALKELLSQMQQQMTKRGKELVFSAIGVSAYNWEANRISNDDIRKHLNELEYIQVLAAETICCQDCKSLNKNCHKIESCRCIGDDTQRRKYDNWVHFVEAKDMVVWRREHTSGLFEYKVYGSFNDVNAEDFLNVQIDGDYRKQWDDTAVALEVIESDPNTLSHSDIIYWELLWPKLFSNRDYVYNRRFTVDYDSKKIVILNRTTEHPSQPVQKNKYRVQDYWSCMVIQPYEDFDKPGVEFGMTYFDNPGLNIPSTITTWVSMRAMPDFLIRLRAATKKYNDYCTKYMKSRLYQFTDDTKSHKISGEDNLEKTEDDTVEKPQLPEIKPKCICPPKKCPPVNATSRKDDTNNFEKKESSERLTSDEPVAEVILSPSAIIKAEPMIDKQQIYWKYLHPNYYFS